jgi:hypothetical protein
MNNPSERSSISIHEVKVFRLLQSNPDKWMTNKDVAAGSSIAERTARMHTLRLVRLGVLEQAEVFPGHRYRWSTKASNRNVAYTQRLEACAEVFGL